MYNWIAQGTFAVEKLIQSDNHPFALFIEMKTPIYHWQFYIFSNIGTFIKLLPAQKSLVQKTRRQ